MWSLKQRNDGTFYLTYDRTRRFDYNYRGIWEWIGVQGSAYTESVVRKNRAAGYICCEDDEGSVRILVLED